LGATLEKVLVRHHDTIKRAFSGQEEQREQPRGTPCNGYLAHLFKKVAPWAFTARLFLVVKWGLAIEIAGEKLSWTRETTRVWAADHDDWSAKVAGEGCKRPLEA
jgi:hypothetical protein